MRCQATTNVIIIHYKIVLQYIQKELPAKAETDQDAFMNLAYSIKVNPKKMKKLEKEYTVIKTKEQGDIAVLRVSNISLPRLL